MIKKQQFCITSSLTVWAKGELIGSRRTTLLKTVIKKSQTGMYQTTCSNYHKDCWRMSYGQIRQKQNFLPKHNSSMFKDRKLEHIKKRTLYLLWNMEESVLCSVLLCFIWHRVSESLSLQITMKSQDVLPTVKKFGLSHRSWIFNRITPKKHPKNTARNIQEWLRGKHTTILKWPLSPYLNPIDHFWKELKHAIQNWFHSKLREMEQCADE